MISNFTIYFIEDVLEKDDRFTKEMIANANEPDLIGIAQILNIDAIFLSNITILPDKSKNIWSKELKKRKAHPIALFQGNIISQDNKLLIRFADYFYIN